jgi:hypothetical protein
MSTASNVVARHAANLSGTLVARVIVAAVAVGVLDGLYVVGVFVGLMHVTTATRIFQGIARALLGESAFAGGTTTAAVGLAMHFGVALAWSTVWGVIYQWSARIRHSVAANARALMIGAAFGLAIHLIMNRLVLPLTLAPPAPPASRSALLVLLAHVTVVGPVMVLLVRMPRADTFPQPPDEPAVAAERAQSGSTDQNT